MGKLVFIGIACFLGVLFSFAAINVGMIPPLIYMILTTMFGMAGAVMLIMENHYLGDIGGVFMNANMKKRVVACMLTPSGNIEMLTGREEEGFLLTEKGYINIPKGTVFSWPNGVKGGFGYLRFGTLLPPKIVEAATTLKKKGFRDIHGVEKMK